MFKKINPSAADLRQGAQTEDAVFMGWQRMRSGEVFALYNVISVGHPSFGSTVTHNGLRKLNLKIPRTPPPQEQLTRL